MSSKDKGTKTLAENRKARHDYFIEETYEAGIVLVGTEVKSIRQGKANLKDSYADIRNSEVFVKNMHISPYEQGNIFNVDPLRERKLLLHASEIRKLIGYTA
ncbi:MAG: SsrA-binding protein SmpB, partial [Clostridiales bacterium]|nr:SsrA-binding protein SmpB [Clostridiales bacterium]